MSGTIENLVETSCNPGILKLYGDELFVQTSIRSSVGTAKEALSHKIQYLTEFLGGEYETEGLILHGSIVKLLLFVTRW